MCNILFLWSDNRRWGEGKQCNFKKLLHASPPPPLMSAAGQMKLKKEETPPWLLRLLKKISSFSMPQSFKWKGEKLKQKDFNFFISVISSVFQAVPQISKHAWNRNIENTPPDCISRASERTLTLERLKRSCSFISAALFLHKHANRKAQSQPLLKFNQHLLLLEIIHPEA